MRTLLVFLLFCIYAHAKNTVTNVAPHVIQQGTETTVVIYGNRLHEVKQFLAYTPGIEMVKYEPISEHLEFHNFRMKKVEKGQAIAITLRVSKDCAIGKHLFRLRTNETLSEMRAIWVSPFKCVDEELPGHDSRYSVGSPVNGKEVKTAGNGSFDKAQKIDLNTTINGYHPAYSFRDYDFYEVDLKKGQRLTVEQWAADFTHGGGNDGVITLYGPDKKQLAKVDDTWLSGEDPIVSIIAKASGPHFIKVHQSVERELGARSYALHVGSGVRPFAVYPLGGKMGETLDIRYIGSVGSEKNASVKLPKSSSKYDESTFKHFPKGSVIANPLRVSSFGNVLEDGKDHFTPESAQVYSGSLPIAFNGIIEHEGKTDWFKFKAKKGERYRIRCYAATLGTAIDPQIWIQGAPGSKSKIKIHTQDSYWQDRAWSTFGKWTDASNMDPITIFEPDVDGEYVLGVADEQRLFGPDYVYRVEISPVVNQTQFCITTDYRESSEKRDTLIVPRGNRIERTLRKIRVPGNNYNGSYKLVAKGLPAGVKIKAPIIKANDNVIQLQVEADANAKPWAGFVDIQFVPLEKGKQFTGGYVLNAAAEWARGGLIDSFMPTRRCALAVVDPAPFKIHLNQPKLSLAQSAVLDLEISVERIGGFKGDVQVWAPWKPNYVSSGTLLIPAGKTKGTLQLKATDRAVPGDYDFVVSAFQNPLTHEGDDIYLNTGLGFNFVASNEVTIKIVQPYVQVNLARTAIERQKEGYIVADLKHLRPLPRAATAKLIRLPAGTELIKPVTIKPGEKQVRFPIRISKDCLTGMYKQIACEITIEENGQTITQLSGSGTLRVDAERK